MAVEIPEGFSCPITRRVMQDPVYLTADSRTYERGAIDRWFAKGHLISPSTGRKIKSPQYQPDHGLRKAIQKWLQRYPEFLPKPFNMDDEVEAHRIALGMSAMSIEDYPADGSAAAQPPAAGAYYQPPANGAPDYEPAYRLGAQQAAAAAAAGAGFPLGMESPAGMVDDSDGLHRQNAAAQAAAAAQAGAGYVQQGGYPVAAAAGGAVPQQRHHASQHAYHQPAAVAQQPAAVAQQQQALVQQQQRYAQQHAQQAHAQRVAAAQAAQAQAQAAAAVAAAAASGAAGYAPAAGESKEQAAQQQQVAAQQQNANSTGFHSFLASGTKFIIDLYYKPLKPVGTGAYGIVVAAQDTRTNTKVAIKKISNAFDDVIDAKRILREIKLLAHFDHENVVALLDLVPPLRKENFEDVYMVMGFMETDLHKIIYSKNPLSEEHCQYFIYQVLRGTKYIHSANVIHRDLKPSNLLLNQNCDLKICDLGLARGVDNSNNFDLTEYVVTRWYRAPEIMCSCQEYDRRIDVWSIGCILGEILGRKPLFPGENYIHQLNLIFKYLGTPKPVDLDWITNDKALTYIRDQPYIAPVPWNKIFPEASACSLDLLSKMLVFNPNKRISVDDALRHPFLKQLHNPDDEPVCDVPFNFDFEKDARTDKGIRRLMYEEVMNARVRRRPRAR